MGWKTEKPRRQGRKGFNKVVFWMRRAGFVCLEFQCFERGLLRRVDGGKMCPLQPLYL
jgi:hypothetical protein